jgi:hypothetical protein
MPILRAVGTFAIFVDFIKLRRYNRAGARNCVTNRGDGERHLIDCLAKQYVKLPAKAAKIQGSKGKPVDQHLKQLMKELGEAINESLADSDQIAEVVSRIKEGGYEIFLVLEATIGVSKPGDKTPDKTSLVTTLSSSPEFKVSDQDLKFLKSLRIKIDDDAA